MLCGFVWIVATSVVLTRRTLGRSPAVVAAHA
jgi:hypothetical protein